MGIFDDISGKKGDTPSAAKPDFSNVQSGGSSTAPAAPEPVATSGSGKTYVVMNGDDRRRQNRVSRLEAGWMAGRKVQARSAGERVLRGHEGLRGGSVADRRLEARGLGD